MPEPAHNGKHGETARTSVVEELRRILGLPLERSDSLLLLPPRDGGHDWRRRGERTRRETFRRDARDSWVVSDPVEERSVVECGGYRFFCRNREEFERICHDVFDGHEYAFETRRRAPLIVDAGAHVGVATHYFKNRYPHARVLALEANPITFALLRKNISHNGLDDVRAIHAALAPEAGTIPFFATASDEEPGAWGDSVIRQPWHEGEATAVVQVPAVTLSSLLTEPVDLLKLDIEGLETAVLEESASRLSVVRGMILEFHGTRRNPGNSILRLTEILRAAGFTPEVRQFGEEVALSDIQEDEPHWLMVRAERLNPWQRLRRRGALH
jgi:FkbM family methyltransferase